MRKWLRDNIITVLTWLLPSGGALVVAVLALFQNVPWYLIALSIVATAVLIIVGINQFETWRERHKKRFSQLTDKEIEDTIYKWISIPFFQIQSTPDPKLFWFHFAVTGSDKIPVNIFRSKEAPNQILLASAGPISEEFDSLEASVKEDLIIKLRIEVLRFGINYGGIGLPFTRLYLYVAIPLDDLSTELDFRQRIGFVRRAVALIKALIVQNLKDKITPGKESRKNEWLAQQSPQASKYDH